MYILYSKRMVKTVKGLCRSRIHSHQPPPTTRGLAHCACASTSGNLTPLSICHTMKAAAALAPAASAVSVSVLGDWLTGVCCTYTTPRLLRQLMIWHGLYHIPDFFLKLSKIRVRATPRAASASDTSRCSSVQF